MTPLDKKAAELEWKLRSLPYELKAWRDLSELKQPFEKHHSQIRRLALQMEGLHKKVVCDFGQFVKDATLLTFVQSLEKRALAIHTVWDFFRSKFALRAVEPLGSYLKMADAYARECYEPVRQKFVAAGGADRREPPLVTFDNRVSPWSLSREATYTPASDPGGIVATTAFSEVVSRLPIPLLGIPWHYITYLPHVVFLAHECGHAVEKDFGLDKGIQLALDQSKIDAARLSGWQAWRHEIFADVFACYAAGPSYATALADVLTRDSSKIAEEVRTQQRWGDYPTTTLRILLNTEALSQFGFVEEAKTLQGRWLTDYPGHAMKPFVDDLPAVVKALHKGAALPEKDLAFTAAYSAQSRKTANLYFAGGQHSATDVYPVRVLIAAAREMLTLPGATQPILEQYWEALCRHAVTSRPPGMLAAEAQRASKFEPESERTEAEALADVLFGAISEED
jgi:hypothetical protein